MEIVLLLGAGFVGGVLNSLAGGGSFIVFPALLLAGVPPVAANATNTFAALPGYISGAIGYRRDLLKYKRRLLSFGLAALVGGYLGAELLLHVSDEQFAEAVPWLMALAVILFAFGGRLSAWIASWQDDSRRMAIAGGVLLYLLLVLVCVYGGFFNAGLGINLLAFLALAGMTDIHAMNGLKLAISTVVAAIAVGRFAMSGSIAWYEGTLALLGTLTGGYLAARIAHRIPTPVIRFAVIVYGLALTLVFFWQTYG